MRPESPPAWPAQIQDAADARRLDEVRLVELSLHNGEINSGTPRAIASITELAPPWLTKARARASSRSCGA